MTPEEAAAEIARTVPVLHEEAQQAMRDAVELTWQRMSEYAPHGETGELSRDITHTVTATADGIRGTVRPRARYAEFVEGGTGLGKTIRSRGRAYSATTGGALSAAQEAASPFDVMTAYGYGATVPGKKLALHVRGGGVIYRSRVRGQRARGFVQRTRDATAGEVERKLADGAVRATRRLFP